ncbi:beta strand repeat-containing protein, partial [Sphingobium sp. HDIP04]|uniref:beta strand repeat-containing protein n=1 Tax=Sphingobium sp. HDIP04 TaxID=428994 RepID=UPI0003876AF5
MTRKHGAFSLWTLLGRTSAVALAVGLGAGAAIGQKAFQGSYSTSPDVFISQGALPNTDTVSLNSAQAVIDWTPDDRGPASAGTIDFLPQGSTVTFSSFSDFTVLNRILPLDGNGLPVSRVIAFNGTVQSRIGGNPPITGGAVWFYSPGGIIAGANSVFNVGSLVLTTNAIDISNGLDRNNIRFAGPAGSTSSVELLAGAQINALSSGSYVALVAPRVVQGGTVTVNGSTAYVGAEAADIRINNGLFDIAITAGTTDADGVVHSGTTTGPESVDGNDMQRVFMVAVPKNNALTMLLSGNVGYTPATAVTPDGSAVVLSAGSDIAHDTGGNLVATRNATTTAEAGFSIGSGDWQNDLTGTATGDIVIRPTATAHFLGNVALSAERGITLRADQSAAIAADKDMILTAGSGAAGGRIDLLAFGGSGAALTNGQIDVAGNLRLNASGDGEAGVSATPLVGGDASGGTINLIATGGSIAAASVVANAVGYAGYGSDRSGDAAGGAITLSALTAAGPSGTEGGSLSFGSTTLDASAGTAFQVSVPPVDGGNAIGGTIALNGAAGAVIAGGLDLGAVSATAQATGGIASTGAAGDATGGDIRVAISGGTHEWASFFADTSTAPGHATEGGSYGAAVPGANGIDIDVGGTGSLNILTSVSLYADARAFGGGASGGALRAGRINIAAHDGGSFAIAEDLFATADAYGFAAYPGSTFLTPGTADALGGVIGIGAAGGSFSAAELHVSASGFAGDAPGVAGTGTGGSVTLFASASGGRRGSFSLGDCTGSCSIHADGGGGAGANGSNGTGGSVLLYASDADFSALGELSLHAHGIGGGTAYDDAAGRGGDGLGGSVTVEGRLGAAGSGDLRFGNLLLSAEGASAPSSEGISFNGGDAGNGTGGSANVILSGGSLTADLVDAGADGFGGAAGENCPDCEGGGTTSFRAGNGRGGSAGFLISGGTATLGALALSAQGVGGEAEGASSPQSAAAIAGAGFGGDALLESRGGTLDLTTLAIDASGVGGAGYPVFQADGADGGAGTGGAAGLLMTAGSSGQVAITGSAIVRASGTGGAGAVAESGGP